MVLVYGKGRSTKGVTIGLGQKIKVFAHMCIYFLNMFSSFVIMTASSSTTQNPETYLNSLFGRNSTFLVIRA